MKYKNTIFLLLVLLVWQPLMGNTLRIIHYKYYYPYAFVNQKGKPDGVLIDYWKLWAKVNKQNIEFISANESEFINKIENGQADIIAGTIINDSLTYTLDYAEYIMRINTILFINKKHSPKFIHDIDFTILVLKNQNILNILSQKFPDLTIKVCNGFIDFEEKVNSNNYGGFIYDYPSPINSKTNLEIPKGYYSFYTLSTAKLRPAVKKGNFDLRNLIINGNDKITDEELSVIAIKWDIVKKSYTIIWVVSLFSGLLMVLIFLSVFILKKHKKQTLQITNFNSLHNWQAIINKGENDLVEFKSSLRWDYHQQKPNKALEYVIVKTIAAFLNTNGGMLFIGVNDEGNTLGLDKDYQSLSKKNRDGFNLAITNLVNKALGKNTHQYISINIIEINSKDVCIVTVKKSKKPFFLSSADKEEFYIRASASSQPMGMSETYKYISTHWNK